MEYEYDGDTKGGWCTLDNPKRIGKGIRRLGNKRTSRSRDYLEYTIIKIIQNTEKSPGDLRRLAVTQTPVRNHQLILVWKTLKGIGCWQPAFVKGDPKIPFLIATTLRGKGGCYSFSWIAPLYPWSLLYIA